MDSVTIMIDQLNWQKLEHRRDNSRLCLLFKISMQHKIHVPTNDILPSAFTTATSLKPSHERNLAIRNVICMNRYSYTYIQIFITGNKFSYQVLKKLNYSDTLTYSYPLCTVLRLHSNELLILNSYRLHDTQFSTHG